MKWTALVVLGLGIGPNVLRADDGPPVLLGVARVDVTPDGPIRLHGYQARDRESTGVAQRIWAKALAIGSDEQGATVLVALDNLGVPEALTNELAHRLERVGLTRERLAIAASHTHSAPCLTGVAPNIFGKPLAADQQKRVDDYTRKLIDQLETVCLDALKDRRPGRLAWTQGQVGFAANRRTPGGPVDHSLLALRATALDGKLRAVLTSYACHCTTIATGLVTLRRPSRRTTPVASRSPSSAAALMPTPPAGRTPEPPAPTGEPSPTRWPACSAAPGSRSPALPGSPSNGSPCRWIPCRPSRNSSG
jgi:hypothetical protein